MMSVRYPLSLRNVEDLLAKRGIDVSHETVRFWWNRFGLMFAAAIRKKRIAHLRHFPRGGGIWMRFVKINGKLCYLWRAVDHEGEVLETVVTAKRDKAAALKFLKRIMKKYGQPRSVVTDGLCSYPAAMKEIGNAERHEVGRRLNNRAENAIVKASSYDPEVNRTYAEMAVHYRTAILPARPRKPRDKAKVKQAVLIVERCCSAVPGAGRSPASLTSNS